MLADTKGAEKAPTRRQRLSSSERRDAIIRSAVQLFAKFGFRGTTTRELASAVGVSEPVLYQHFATKKDLYTAIVDEMVASISKRSKESLDALPPETPERQYLEVLAGIIMSWHEEFQEYSRLLMYSALEGHEFAELWHDRATAEFAEKVEGYFQQCMDRGTLRQEDPHLSVKAFICMVAHYGLMKELYGCPGSKHHFQPREKVIPFFVDVFLNGLATKA